MPPGPVTQPADVKGKYGGGSMDWWLLTALAFCVYCLVRRHRLQRALPALVMVALAGIAQPAPAAEGWYLGVRGGWSDSTQDAGDIQHALNALGHDVQVSVEDTPYNFALLGGYAFESGLSLEASLFDLGEFEVTVSGETTAPGALPSDTLSLLGHAGRGVSASLGWTWKAGGKFELTPRLGAYYWETRHEVRSAAGTLRDHDYGVDLTAGLRLAWRIDARWQLGLDFDSWAADGRNDVRTANLFVSYAPGGQ